MPLPNQSGSGALASGVYAALVTPRRPDSTEADTAAFLEYLDRVAAAGVSGIVLFGSTGEFVHFDSEERMRTAGLALKRSKVPVLVNVSHSTLPGAVQLAEHAFDAGASGVLLMPPYFYHYGAEEIATFYMSFSEAMQDAGPVYLYSLPMCTTPMAADLVRQLLRSGNFAGVKDSSGEWPVFEQLARMREDVRFQLLVGNEHVYVRGLLSGADGIISGVSAAVPELAVAIERAVKVDDRAPLETLSTRLDEFMAWVGRFPVTTAIKAAAEARSWVRADFAVPLSERKRDELLKFRGWLQAWLPRTLEACAVVGAVRT